MAAGCAVKIVLRYLYGQRAIDVSCLCRECHGRCVQRYFEPNQAETANYLQPWLYVPPCCALCAVAALKKLPVSVDDLLIDIAILLWDSIKSDVSGLLCLMHIQSHYPWNIMRFKLVFYGIASAVLQLLIHWRQASLRIASLLAVWIYPKLLPLLQNTSYQSGHYHHHKVW